MLCTVIHYIYFSICFNEDIKQPVYVEYMQQPTGSCFQRPTFKQDPPASYRHNDYNKLTDRFSGKTTYDRGHLVPNADYGCHTFIMGNVVPQTSYFNQKIWYEQEKFIRTHYTGMKIMKGCKYNGTKLYGIDIPQGCYWLVLNDKNELVDNRYIDQFTYTENKDLPDWYMHKSQSPDEIPTHDILKSSIIFIFVVGLAVIFLVIFSYQMYKHFKLLENASISDNYDEL